MCKECNVDEFSRRIDYVVVCRSPYNHYASVLKWRRNRRLRKPKNFSSVWINLAKEALGERDGLPSEKTVILYDKWFISEDYRRSIAEQLGLEFTDRRLNIVMNIGVHNNRGSSFDGMQYKTAGQKMDVLNRWKEVEEDPDFQVVYQNEKVREYASRLGFEI
jgi:hypothetical protein